MTVSLVPLHLLPTEVGKIHQYSVDQVRPKFSCGLRHNLGTNPTYINLLFLFAVG